MARLNTKTSATPQSRATTVDTLYRDPTPVERSTRARQSTYSVMSPRSSVHSDKENDVPGSRQLTPQLHTKRKSAPGRRARLPTPDSGEPANPSKRQKVHSALVSRSIPENSDMDVGVFEDEEDAEDDVDAAGLPTPTDAQIDDFGLQEDDDQTEQGLRTPEPADEDDEDDEDNDPALRNYNPNQKPEKRRQIRASYRTLQREIDDNRDEFIKPGSKRLNELIPEASRVFSKVRMTADAVLDSHFLTSVTELSAKQLKNSVNQGNQGIGVDLDQFVSRCIFYMKEGRPPGVEEDQQQGRGPQQIQLEEDEDGDGDGLDWAFLGRNACFPSNRRPPLSSFLLGPLSVQKRIRTVTARRATQRRQQPAGPVTRPEEVRLEQMQKSESSSVTHMAKTVQGILQNHINTAMDDIGEPESEEEFLERCRQHRVHPTKEMEPAVSLFDFVIHPDSFAQTVENLFYVSFIIKEGSAKVVMDNDGLPLLVPHEMESLEERHERNVDRNQAIFSIDYDTWQSLVQAFDIRTSLIPHREPEATDVAGKGWYS